ncbi:MAG: aminopeptidase N [Propionicimonas sp.]|uniref:aminopeptidase N n=1 Tax=Propionicimonas sp. TaxID=1955623 RepID=UPI002B20CC2C|nr:aminopeptidase N [Propionicimonas sp.]MEA4944505.1 aminopeptidase N [Propionicimonas sp.]
MYPANITRADAAERAKDIRTTGYQVLVDLSGRVADDQDAGDGTTFVSTSTIHFSSVDVDTWVNLIADRVLHASLDGEELPQDAFADHKLHFRAAAGDHELTVTAVCRYSRTGEGLHRFVDPVDHRVYLYTQFETADARRMYACFEQPDLKATFELTVIAPDHWTVLSNSPAVEPTPEDEGLARFSFAPTPPISTYITALIAGEYHTVTDSYAGRAAEIPLSLSCRQSLVEFLDADRLFATTKAGFAVFEEHFGFPYPFADYAQIFVPEFNAGAMENAGCVTIRDEYLYRSRTTNAAYESRDNTILHELAHMWFGDLVTMTWWDDLWLNESFAEWASHFAQAKRREAGGDFDDPWATFANSRKTWGYRQDQLPSTHPIAADMVDLEAVELNFDGITYAKGASVLRQLVAFVGEEGFLAGVRAYFAKHAWGNTRFDDLLEALTEASGRDLSRFAADWLQTCGVNTLRAEFSVDDDGRFTSFAIRQTAAPAWPTLRQHRLAVGLYSTQARAEDRTDSISHQGEAGVDEPSGERGQRDGRLTRFQRVETDIAGELTELPELVGQPRPDLILLNDDDLTYAKIRFDDRSLATLVGHLASLDSALSRALVWGASWDMCRDAELNAADFTDMVLGGVGVETDLTAVGAVLGEVRTAIDYYAPRADREALNEHFARGLARLLKDAEPGSDHQLAFARALVGSAESEPAIEVLRAWLDGEEAPAGLAIDTDLRWQILTQLARRGAVGEDTITAEAGRDATAAGAEKAAGARAAQPTAEAKATAWALATADPEVANETHFQVCSQFWQLGQDEVLAPYVQAYVDVAKAISDGTDGWADRSSALRQHVLGLLFPRPLADRELLGWLDAWLRDTPLTDAVRRQINERRDDAERALRCQTASLSAAERVQAQTS